ncbi:Limit dextrin alpha-1,6-maltotetraose-hydrolase [hydrothermal vent metagenome]|uniref:Limit dextrin alpha-1,6-maltotetraose-hydrolase n=1 Tax=hydrothermal vent metagenome TaxID=652676 RepID=A0A3B1BMV7_9ZZZZ
MKKGISYSLLFITLFLFQSLLHGENLFIYKENESKIFKKNESNTKHKDLDKYYSTKRLGSFCDEGKTTFRLFTPNAKAVKLFLYKDPTDETPYKITDMTRDENGVWETVVEGEERGIYYGYKVSHSENENFGDLPLCIDPYSKGVTSYTDYYNPRKSIVYQEDYDWGNDTWIERNWRDLIIYEMHIRDMSAHPSAEAEHPGTYKGLVEKSRGGINYIKELGVNTVELLPAQEYGNVEIPYKDSLNGMYNTWNPYERNHWGYMTAAFFAPSSYYSENWKEMKMHEWMGRDASQVNEFKDMVKAFHAEGIAVMMDVVYNHLSEYEIGNLKQIDKEYYFRLNKNGEFIAQSYCGNDLKTERPMVRRLIIDSIIYWMTEYHIDGFRFDLGKLIDWETLEEIIREARKINPNVVLVAEPWGGGYDPKGFSLREWGSWNDQIRNGIKGENPKNGLGWIFGKWYGNNNPDRIKSYINGTLIKYKYGLFQKPEHSVNYLASHDGYTLGDFIRIGTHEVNPKKKIKDIDANAKLTEKQMKLNKLGALFLFMSQGITMIHEGQEFARSKVIAVDKRVKDKEQGHLDHNSYNKDNYTNYINFDYAELNSELVDYYKGLIELRKTYKALRRAKTEQIKFFDKLQNEFSIGFSINTTDNEFIVLMNADQNSADTYTLPEGSWQVLVNGEKAGVKELSVVSGSLNIPAVTGMVLRKVKN